MSDERRAGFTLHNGIRALAAVEIGIFALLWMGFGIGAFFWICSSEAEYDHRMAMIRTGEVEPVALHVVAVHRDEDRRAWLVEVGNSELGVVAHHETKSIDGLAVGTPVQAYRFSGEYFVPRFYSDARWGKYIFLGFGLIPVPVLLVVFVLKWAGRGNPSGV